MTNNPGDSKMIVENAKQAAEDFKTSMAKIFPNYIAGASVSDNLGPAMTISFANVGCASEAPNSILMNASGYMRFMMHLCDNCGNVLPEGPPVEIKLLMWSIPYRSEVIKFRKIKGKTPAEAMQKLVKWFEKNAEAIRGL